VNSSVNCVEMINNPMFRFGNFGYGARSYDEN